MLPTESQVLAAARTLCKIHAGQCQVDEEDTWSVYSEQFKDDARDALTAAIATQPAQPSAQGEAVEIDYEELIAAAFKLHRYAQGTRGCVAFKHGAEWMHGLLASAPAAPAQAVPLTTEQVQDLAKYAGLDWQRGYIVDDIHNRYEDFARAIEAHHGIKAAP